MTDEHPPTQPGPVPPRETKATDTYDLVTDTVTGVNLRFRDNLLQGVAIAAFALVGIVVGFILGGGFGAAVGLIGGLVVGVLLSGLVLGVYRLIVQARTRSARKRK